MAAALTPAVLGFVGSGRVRERPYGLYRVLRAADPVHRSPLGFWVVSTHADVSALLRHPDVGCDAARVDSTLLRLGPLRRVMGTTAGDPSSGPFVDMIEQFLLFRDPPDHARLRSLVSRAFTPRRIAGLEHRVAALTDAMIAPLRGRSDFDLMGELAYPLPARVICELIGLPEEDHALIARHGPALAVGLDPSPLVAPAAMAAADVAVEELTEHLRGHVRSRRARPRDDLLSDLVRAEQDGDRLSEQELIATLVLLLVAGHETTANLIGNAVRALDRHPAQRDRLAHDPALAATAVEELLRLDPPVQLTQRITLAPIEVGGRVIPPGSIVVLLLAAANRDPAAFADPHHVDLAREANPHVSFGAGAHFCLGAALARLEGRIVLPALFRARPGLRPVRPLPRHRDSLAIRGHQRLLVGSR